VVALTSYQDEELVQAAVQAGATSYVLKNVSTEELAQIIRDAYHGKSTLSPEATQALIRLAKRTPHSNYGLTEREHEVLALMIKGMSNGEIADRLTISRFTVKKHVSNILAKLSVSSRTEAVAMAIQNKLVDVSG
jgi:NarL family two-component system response regulator LiaR